MAPYIMALDEGTTSARAVLFDERGRTAGIEQREFAQSFPQPGWVEHDPNAIWEAQLAAMHGVLGTRGARAEEIVALGITNQRETALIWDRSTGEPIYPAIVWQSRQTASICHELRARGLAEDVRRRTGLVIDAYFSATKLRFILDAVPGAQERAERGELAFGTIDSWLIHRLTAGSVHATDETNASRTMLYDIHARDWSDDLLAMLDIPRALLPEVRPSGGDFGQADARWLGRSIPIAGVAGDQQSALFGQRCIRAGQAKNTYGTGSFLLAHTGNQVPESPGELLTTVAARPAAQPPAYALEGSIFVTGAAVQWLRDGLRIIDSAEETDAVARSVPDAGGVYVVPAFTGLGAPHCDEAARGTIVGLTRGTAREHLIRATLESIAFQVYDVVDHLADSGTTLDRLRVDGGACRNDFLMQFQADVLGIPVERPAELEVTALGAAALAGISRGFWKDFETFDTLEQGAATVFEPQMGVAEREQLLDGWRRAVDRARDWARE